MKARLYAGALIVVMTVSLQADTLVLTNGRRVQGQLVGVADGQIEFEEQVGRRSRVLVIAREDVARIEFSLDQPGTPVPPPVPPIASAPSVPRGMREKIVEVQGNQRWNDTGIDVREGQQLYFSATGEVRWGPRNRKDGARGERNSPVDNTRPLPDRPAAALLGNIGDGENIFFIGAELGPFRARQSGRLYLGINDGHLPDNSGSLRVKVSY